LTSLFISGRAFNVGIERTFKERQIEDLWIPYFCITTDITNSSMRIHTHGKIPYFCITTDITNSSRRIHIHSKIPQVYSFQ
jgi:predicted acylesterase/phospholipase RssA